MNDPNTQGPDETALPILEGGGNGSSNASPSPLAATRHSSDETPAPSAVRIGPRFVDDFRGDNTNLLGSIDALLRLHAEGGLSHPIPGMARQLLNNAAARIQANANSAEVGWRDISTAPRDVTEVLVWDEHSHLIHQAVWKERHGVYASEGWFAMPFTGDTYRLARPTHWMPLPEAPR